MSESQAGDTSLIDPKVKNSLLDGDIGQDLFSSWKSASATEDEDMDFNFETETKGKKKAFSFDKLDMDFNIGGGFDNISIFKMGMPDLDFSSPSEKNAKPGEKMKEKSVSGDGPGKKEHFTFSFDFNKLEDFDFRSSLEKEDKKSNKNLNLKDVLDKSKCYGSGNHKVQNVGALDGSRGHEPPTIIPPETSSKFSNLVASGGQGTHLAKEVTSSADAKGMKGYQTDKTNLTEPCPQLAIGNIVSEVQTESYIQDAIVSSSSGDDKHVNLDIVTAKENNEKNSQQQSTKSSPVNIDMLRTNADQNIDSVRDNHVPVETIQSTSPAQACADLTTTSTIRDLRKSPHPISKLTCPPSSSELRIEKLNSREDKETGVIRTKFSKTSEEAEFQLHQASSGSKIDNIIHHTLENERREGPADAQTVGKLPNNSKSSAGKLPKSILVFPADKAKDLSDARDEFKAAQKLTKGKLLSDTRKHHKEASNLENASLVSEKDDNDLNRMRSTVQTTVSVGEKRSKFLDSRKVPHQQSLGSSLKAVERTLDISTFKISRTQGVKNNLSHTKLHTDVKSLRNTKEIDVHGNAASKTVPARVVVADKQILSNPSLKRKTYEASNADVVALSPRKRLLESPRESRHGDQLENGVAEQACDRDDLLVESNFKTACHDGSASTIVPQEVNLKEKEIHSLVENDGNVDKAEAYTKDLENICNTLKRKHEEAKELLVRAIVSNNYLLMLNHPIFEDKIGRVQKFAARLMSGKTQNCSV